jgi:prepilin-type N-terminal cleavage/methylation domain-containing protein
MLMKHDLPSSRGFTLVEILMVIAIIGVLATIAIPHYMGYQLRAKAVSLTTEVKAAAQAFRTYKMENNTYPADRTPGATPPEIASLIGNFFSMTPPIGGQWDWDYQQFGITAGISVYNSPFSTEELQRVDRLIDDDNLFTGTFRQRPSGYIYVIEE